MAQEIDRIEQDNRPLARVIRRPFPSQHRGPGGKAQDQGPSRAEQPVGRLPARFFQIAVPRADRGQRTPRAAQQDGPGDRDDDIGFRHLLLMG